MELVGGFFSFEDKLFAQILSVGIHIFYSLFKDFSLFYQCQYWRCFFVLFSVTVFQCITEPRKCELKNLNLNLVARMGNLSPGK